MKIVSSRILTLKLGDSKLSFHNLNGFDKYILTVQNSESENLSILGQTENGYQLGKDGEGDIGQYVIIDDIEEQDLHNLSEKLKEAFPSKEKK